MDAADPETFVAAVAAVLSDYPVEIVAQVIDPRTGLPGTHRFPPDPFEVRQACERVRVKLAGPAARPVFVGRDTDAGRAWAEHRRAAGERPIVWFEYGRDAEPGRTLPTAWPPGHTFPQAAE